MIDFEKAIDELDLRLFEKIPSQSTDHDKRSLLACQVAVRELSANYTYLEIGSYLGGSIQPHLLDPKCRRVYSIDKRPVSQPDVRGYEWRYQNNSTARMLEMLKGVNENTEKIVAIDADTRTIDSAVVADKIDLCFIDGEHTDEAVIADFQFCLSVLAAKGAVMFHDAQITYRGLAACVEHLEVNKIGFRAYLLPHVVFVIEIGGYSIHRNEKVADRLAESYQGFLYSLQENDHYRRFANRFPFGALRRLKLKLRGGNVSE